MVHKIYEQYIAEIYGLTLNKQEAKSWYKKYLKFDLDIDKLTHNMTKILNDEKYDLYFKMLENHIEFIENRYKFLYTLGEH